MHNNMIIVLCCLFGFALSHTVMTSLIVDGTPREDCLRKVSGNKDGVYDSYPLMDTPFPRGILSDNYTCGFLPYASQPAKTKCEVKAGSTVTGTYWHGSYGDEDPVLDRFIARSHKGPIMVSMAKSETGQGKVWFKIWQKGLMSYDPKNWQNNKWASPDLLLEQDGKISVLIPEDITPGNYLLRFELLALHSATQQSGAQPYVRCAEITVTGSGSVNPAPLMQIPSSDYATLTSPGVLFSLYQSPLKNGANYTYPGGDYVYNTGDPVIADNSATKSGIGSGATVAIVVVVIAVVVGAIVGAMLFIKFKRPGTWDSMKFKAQDIKDTIKSKV